MFQRGVSPSDEEADYRSNNLAESRDKTICLVMIVKNEAAVIRRCLEAVKPIISHWIICDTGSTDGTPAIIREILRGIPGTLYEDAWRDFGHNRTLAMRRARGKADYHLLIDADMVVNVRDGGASRLTEDAYLIRFEGPVDYSVIRLVSDQHEWRYLGLTHEYIFADSARAPVTLPTLTVTHHEDGGNRSEKYRRDIALLSEGIVKEPTNSRYAYYLAQSHRDVGDFQTALDWYEKRVLMGGWEEETWSALYQMARMQQFLGNDWRVVLNSY